MVNTKALVCAAIMSAGLLLPATGSAYTGNDLDMWLSSHARVVSGTGNAKDLENLDLLTGYVAGTYDALDVTGNLCAPNNVTLSQMIAAVSKEHKNSPEKWTENARGIVIVGLVRSFPCGK